MISEVANNVSLGPQAVEEEVDDRIRTYGAVSMTCDEREISISGRFGDVREAYQVVQHIQISRYQAQTNGNGRSQWHRLCVMWWYQRISCFNARSTLT